MIKSTDIRYTGDISILEVYSSSSSNNLGHSVDIGTLFEQEAYHLDLSKVTGGM